MERRDFIRTTAVIGGSASLGRFGALNATELAAEALGTQRPGPTLDPADRSRSRDPMAVQRSTLVVDGVSSLAFNDQLAGKGILAILRAGGINCIVTGGGSVQSFANKYNYLDAHKNEIVAARTVNEIQDAHQQGKISCVFHSQNPSFLEDLTGYFPPTPLRAHYELGLRVIGLTYNISNIFAGGSIEPEIGLTQAGRRLVEEIHKLGMVLDLSGHTGEPAAFQAIEMAPGVPVIASHSNPAALNPSKRNISDRLMEATAKTGGVIGVCAYNDFLMRSPKDVNTPRSPQGDVEMYLNHFDYVRQKVGIDHVSWAGDHNLSPRSGRLADPRIMPRDTYSDTGDKWVYVKGFETPAELPNVTRGLVQRGWSTEEIRKLLGENWLRVFKRVWGA